MKWINANNLETWAGTAQGPINLPGLVGALIRATVTNLSHYRFPEGDKGKVRGFDGVVETITTSAFVPDGRSIWEFGVEKTISTKAWSDFDKRSKAIPEDERKDLSFVFVTPQTWDTPREKLHDLIDEMKAAYVWKDVRLIDGSQLETWLDERPAVASRWAREVIGNYPKSGALSTDEFWEAYSRRFDPQLTEDVLLAGRDAAAADLVKALLGDPGRYPLMADSPTEVIAFAVAAIRRAPAKERDHLEARTLVLKHEEVAADLAGYKNLVFLPMGSAVGLAGLLSNDGPTVVALGQDQKGRRESTLPRPSADEMAKALETMGFDSAKSRALGKAVGRSVTILERQIASANVERPRWAKLGRALLPAMLAGAWNANLEPDRERLADLNAPGSYLELLRTLQPLTAEQDPFIEQEHPIWLTRAPVDAFIQLGSLLTLEDLERLEKIATTVFSEVVAPSDAPFAPHNDGYAHSDFLRQGLAQTLLQIAMLHDEARLTVPHKTPQAFVNDLISNLPGLRTDTRLMASLRDELIVLAEAAPDPFLSALEHLLEGKQPKALALFDESPDIFGRSGPYSNVLWALEALAWPSELFPRVALVLARLAEIDPGGRYANRPKSTLRSIFLLWNPGTNATWEERQDALSIVVETYPAVGWTLLLSLLPGRHESALATVRPRFRDGGGRSEHVTNAMVGQGARHVADLLIDHAGLDAERWTALIRRLTDLPPEYRAKVFEGLDAARPQLPADAKAAIWEALRKELRRHEAFASTAWAIPAEELRAYQEVTQRFGVEDILVTTRTLFTELPLAMNDFDQAMADLKIKRRDALRELHAALGVPGILALARINVEVSYDVAVAAVEILETPEAVFELFEAARHDPALRPFAIMLSGISYNSWRDRPERQIAWRDVVRTMHDFGAPPPDIASVCFHWPDTPETWSFLIDLDGEVALAYWREKPAVSVALEHLIAAILFYLAVERGSAALRVAHNHRDQVPAALILNMLDTLVLEINAGRVQPDTMTGFYVEGALDALDKAADADAHDIARREFSLLSVIEYGSRHLALQRLMATDPFFFFSLIQTVFRGEGDPVREEPSEQEVNVATLCFRLLMKFDTLPGSGEDGVDAAALAAWVDGVRQLGRENARGPITDQYVGQALANSHEVQPFWPGVIVAAEIERAQNQDVDTGVEVGRFNQRGVTSRGMDDGGAQEWTLVERYQAWAKAARGYPRTVKILESIAETYRGTAEREDREVRLRNARD